MKNRIRFVLLCTLLCLAWISPLQAEEETDGVGVLLNITPKAGHDEALLKGIEDYHKWVANLEGHMRFNWWKVVTGPDTGKYIAYSGNHDWSEFDAKYDWEEQSNEVIKNNVLPHIESMERSMHVDMDEVSHWPEDWSGYTHLQVESWYIVNGQYGAFNKGLKRIVEALKEGGFPRHFGFSSLASGGHGSTIALISPVKGWSGMAEMKPSFYDIMIEELGGEEEFQAFMGDWGKTFKIGHNQMLEYLPAASDYGDE